MLIFARKPSPRRVVTFLDRLARSSLSYDEVGCTWRERAPGFHFDRQRFLLGTGAAAFDNAVSAFRQWKQFDVGWVEVGNPDCPIEPGRLVAVIARVGFVWMMCGCRILEVVDEPGKRFGFSYGTLREHPESGEERFLVERAGDEVWYDVLALSRLARWYVRAAEPIATRLQDRFRSDSGDAMRRWVQDHASPRART